MPLGRVELDVKNVFYCIFKLGERNQVRPVYLLCPRLDVRTETILALGVLTVEMAPG